MATITRRQPVRVGSTSNRTNPRMMGGQEQPWIVEDASQTWVKGDLLYANATDGKIVICTNSSDKLNSQVGGIAIKAASGVENTSVRFHAITPDDIIEMNVYHGTVGSAITARNQLGQCYGIKLISGKWVVDLESDPEGASTALAYVKVIGFSDKDTLGDTYGRVHVVFLPFTHEDDGGGLVRVLQFA